MADRPHILLITADQMRWDCLGCAGNPVIETPNLDRLAARGVRFRNAFTPNPICVPARATIMTGNYSHLCTGVKSNSGRIRDGQPLLTEVLKAAGYRTYALGKLHFLPYSAPGEPRLVHGFEHVELWESGRILKRFDPEGKLSGVEDYFDYLKEVGWAGFSRAHGVGNNDVRPCPSPVPKEHHVDSWIAECTMRAIDSHLARFPDRPFFMWMSSPKPHSPYDPPRPFDAMYDPRTIPEPFGDASGLKDRNPALERIRCTHAIDTLSPEALRVIRTYYYGCVSFLDAMIGRVVARLEEKGLIENTLVLFSSDHGDMLGDFGTFFKTTHQNGSVRVPMIAAGPGVARGEVSDALVGLQDILPTFAAAAGAEIGADVHGINLMDHLADTKTPVRDLFYSQTMDSPWQSSMVTDGEWKYVYSEADAVEELYDQLNDPGELDNRARDPSCAERLEDMRSRLRECAEAVGDTAILSGEGFAATEVNREEFKDFPVQNAMGWRWY